MILLLALSGLGTESYIKANAQARMAARESQSRQAVYAAEGGIEWAKAELTVNPGSTGGTLTIGDSEVRVNIVPASEGYWVTSLGTAGYSLREVKVFLKNQSGKWLTSNYHELHR
ncbi:MAG: pilus assembly PilX N-terminal domain-containing protein [Desulfitobacterium hafniense]|nr:pilus assembly PilX N-terminal domain-containing protein [Desulfitobacterium hafniense]